MNTFEYKASKFDVGPIGKFRVILCTKLFPYISENVLVGEVDTLTYGYIYMYSYILGRYCDFI